MTENLLLSRISEYMKSVEMPLPRWVALSGGPDSVCLLHTMMMMNQEIDEPLPLIAVHCNFHLRGEESDRDEQFCRDLCKMLGIEIQVKHFDTHSYMKEKGLSLEMAARELRYDWWNQLWKEQPQQILKYYGQKYFALGHHQDDSIETMLMNLMRGTGIDGLTGIVPINNDRHTIRPLLCLSRNEVLNYLHDNVACPEGWDCNYVTDHTNLENDTLRNQIRNKLIPLMEQMVPQSKSGMLKTMDVLRDTRQYISHKIEHLYGLRKPRMTDDYVYYLLDTSSLSDFEKTELYRYCTQIQKQQVDTSRSTWVATNPQSTFPTVHKGYSLHNIAPENFDLEKIEMPIIWRRWRRGDRIDPLGMNGKTRKLSDLFTDAHYLPIQKQLSWVVTDAQDRIIWVPGLKRCDFAKVTPETKHVLRLEF